MEEKKVEKYEEFQLFLMILDEQGKHEEALKELRGPLGVNFYKVEADRKRKELDYLIILKQWREVHALAHELIDQT